jgi:hypothetical protein
MNKVGRILLLAGVVVLALLVGVLIGRRHTAQPTADVGNAMAVQITTAPPPAAEPAPTPLPAPVQAPQPASLPKLSPDQQVQEDAAAVGMTTKDTGDQSDAGVGAVASPPPAAPQSAVATPASDQPPPPNG